MNKVYQLVWKYARPIPVTVNQLSLIFTTKELAANYLTQYLKKHSTYQKRIEIQEVELDEEASIF